MNQYNPQFTGNNSHNIKRSIINNYPVLLIALYFIIKPVSSIFSSASDGSSYIDEIITLLLIPFGIKGLTYLYKIDITIFILFMSLMIFAAISSINSHFFDYAVQVPPKAYLLGIFLDLKTFILYFATLYLILKTKISSYEFVRSICLFFIFFGLFNSIFFLFDLVSSGRSILGVPLNHGDIFRYAPVGLFSHKVESAALIMISIIASTTLYAACLKPKYLLLVGFFAIMLIMSSSTKELSSLVLCVVVLSFVLFKNMNRDNFFFIFIGVILVIMSSGLMLLLLSDMIINRIDLYFYGESVRGLLYEKSYQIAYDYFPLGSGAGTFASNPSRTLYYSPLYHTYGLSHHYGASPEYSSFLMDTWWPKITAEYGFFGLLSYLGLVLIPLKRGLLGFLKNKDFLSGFVFLIGGSLFAISFASATFTSHLHLAMFSILLCASTMIKYETKNRLYK